jgi:hypothetical protein
MHRGSVVLRIAAATVAAAAMTACVSQGVPLQKGYGTTDRPLFDLVLMALRDLGGEVMAESPQRDSATAHFSAETATMDFFMEVSLHQRLADVTYVQVSVWSELEEVSREDQDYWRERLFDALDAVAGPEAARVRRPPEPGTGVPH